MQLFQGEKDILRKQAAILDRIQQQRFDVGLIRKPGLTRPHPEELPKRLVKRGEIGVDVLGDTDERLERDGQEQVHLPNRDVFHPRDVVLLRQAIQSRLVAEFRRPHVLVDRDGR